MSAIKLIVLLVLCSLALSEASRKGKMKSHHKDRLHKHMKGKGDVDKLIEHGEKEYEKHVAKHGHKFHEEEDTDRLVNFLAAHHTIDEHNKDHHKHGYNLSHNHLSTLHPEEMKSMLGAMHVEHWPANDGHGKRAATTLPASIDWRTKNAVTPVKNQGICGSCWTFGTTGAMEGQIAIKTGKLVRLSEQHLVSCATPLYGQQGCDGGIPIYAFDFAKDNGGLQTEAAYPYVEQNTPETSPAAKCRLPPITKRVSQAGTSTGNSVIITRNSEAALQTAVATAGPVSVAIHVPDGPSFFQYSGGVYSNPIAVGQQPNHAVLVVGYGTENGKDFWIVKNSWADTWGEKGYIRIARNANNMCSIATQAAYPLISSVDTKPLAAAAPTQKPAPYKPGGGIVNPQG
jgi:cathepsin L